nr:hypothetical protein [Tanacetum cinerariifolium]
MDMDTENVEESLKKPQAEGSSKRVRQELEQESSKKQNLAEQEQAKVADDDIAELKRCLKIIHEDDEDDDVSIKATPLSSKSPTIVDYKIYREGEKSYFKIIKADRNSQNYLTVGTMFKNFNREDLEVLRSIVKERFKKTNPGKIVGFKGLHGVTTAQLVLLVYKVVVVFNKVNAAKLRVTTAVRVSTAGWIKWLEDQDMQAKELKIYSLRSTTCSSYIDGFSNGEELPMMVRVEHTTYFQDHKWYDELINEKPKEEALMHKARFKDLWGMQLLE